MPHHIIKFKDEATAETALEESGFTLGTMQRGGSVTITLNPSCPASGQDALSQHPDRKGTLA
ncbi:MAG: hypothetical protein JKY93_03300 [Gammaproteobacteria bacterium]|nr:hypothetical protein [Gammaproteobacteria bacterium]